MASRSVGLGFLPLRSKTSRSSSNRPSKIARENSATFDNYAIVAQKEGRVKLEHSVRLRRTNMNLCEKKG